MTKVYKDHWKNWVAVDELDFNENRVLSIRTSKRSDGKLVSTATLSRNEDGFLSHFVFQDYCKPVASSCPGRVTEKLVTAQHETCLAKLDSIKESVNAFYKEKELG